MKRLSERRSRLEAALFEDPDDRTLHLAYADCLSEQGDPRGEFIRIQLALEDQSRTPEERQLLRQREEELLQAHGQTWLGGLATHFLGPDRRWPYLYQFQFARGWLNSAVFPNLHVDAARALARAPEARLLQRLVIEFHTWYGGPGIGYEEGPDLEGLDPRAPSLGPLRTSPYLKNVRVFQLGEQVQDFEMDGYNCHTSGRGAVDIIRQMPRLEELYLLAHHIDTDSLFALESLPRLRILQVYHLHHYPLPLLAANPALGRLTHLLLHPGGQGTPEEPHIQIDGLRAIARSPHLQSLTHLQLRVSDLGDRGCVAIVRSGLLRRLKMLDLQHGVVTDEGARILASCPDLRHLELLNLNRNQLTTAGIEALRAVGCNLRADNQYNDEEIELRWFVGEGDVE